ncbi:MAG: PilW family protein [Halioglobus sp.]|jgi:type IV pilus assembly protein PilW|nr:PilW family protein [Halioglobus sp.]
MTGNKRKFGCASGRGFSLVELMVSMLLGVILSTGFVSTYLGAKRNAFYDEQMARMQENGRYAMRLLSRELAMVGFYAGVPSVDGVVPVPVGGDCSHQNWALNVENALQFVNDYPGNSVPVSQNATAFTCLDSAAIQLNTDLLAIKRTAGEASLRHGVVADGLTASTGEVWYFRLALGGSAEWEKLRPIDLLDLSIAVPSLSYWEAVSKIFFIRRYSESDFQGDAIPTLCMETLAGDKMISRCLVEGVEDLQFEFGIDTDADGVPNQYKSAPTGNEMRYAVVAKIHILLRSISMIPGYKDKKSYALGQKILPPRHDSYLRRVISSSILLRNRLQPLG